MTKFKRNNCTTYGCGSSAKYVHISDEIEKIPTKCIHHAIPGRNYVLSSRLCIHRGCFRQASFGIPGFRIHCKEHSSSDDVNLANKSKMCINCEETRATFCVPGKKRAEYCAKCKRADYVPYSSFLCITCGLHQPSFCGYNEFRPLRCASCKFEGDRNIRALKNNIARKKKKGIQFCVGCNQNPLDLDLDLMLDNKTRYCSRCSYDISYFISLDKRLNSFDK
jgi:hypothetical protein